MLPLRFFVCASIFMLFSCPDVSAVSRTVKLIAPGIMLEAFEEKSEKDPSIIHRWGTLWVYSSANTPNTKMTMRIGCRQHRPVIALCFSFRNFDQSTASFSKLENDKVGVLAYQIDEAPLVEKNWPYWGGMDKPSKPYAGVMTPHAALGGGEFSDPDAENKAWIHSSNLFFEAIKPAKRLKLRITLENGLNSEAVFRLSALNQGLAELMQACAPVH